MSAKRLYHYNHIKKLFVYLRNKITNGAYEIPKCKESSRSMAAITATI